MSVSPLTANPLTTIHSDDPAEIRRQVVEFMYGQVSCDAAVFFKPVENEDGQRFLTSFQVVGEDRELVEDRLGEVTDGPALDAPWSNPEENPESFNRFIRESANYSKQYVESFEVHHKFSKPSEIGDQMRMVLKQENRVICWVGCMRRGLGEQFRKEEEKRLQAAVKSVTEALRTAENLEADLLNEAHFGVFDERGRLEHASPAFARFATKRLREFLGRQIRKLSRRTSRGGSAVSQGADIEFVRLDGPSGVRYMVTLSRLEVLRLDPAAGLTGRQREIAEYAAHGATVREIADTLDISPHTVKTHIKNIYQRLNISSRVELAQAVLP